MKTMLWIIAFILLLAMFFCNGCNFRNAEKITFNAQGQKTEQIRTGQFNFLYWVGLGEAGMYTDPNSFDVYIIGLSERPDANAIEATGNAAGNFTGTVFKKVAGR